MFARHPQLHIGELKASDLFKKKSAAAHIINTAYSKSWTILF